MSTNNKVAIDWQGLSIPSVWASKLQIIAERLDKTSEHIEGQRNKNFHENTIKQFAELVKAMDDAYKPKPPKTIQDAYEYGKSRKYKGTFLALLDEEGKLVKTVIVKKGEVLPVPPAFSIEDTEVNVKMTQHVIKIPELDIERVIPKRAVKAVPFGSDKEQIIGYGES